MIRIKKFETHSDYATCFADNECLIRPNVSLCLDERNVHYNPLNYYFVFHSSSGELEMVKCGEFEVTDMSKFVAPGYYYGGVASEYGGMGELCSAVTSGDISSFSEGDIIVDSGASLYDGSLIRIDDTSIKYWRSRGVFLTGSPTPDKGVIYYLREIPKDYYLKQYTYFVFNDVTHKITEFRPMFNIDKCTYIGLVYMVLYTSPNESTEIECVTATQYGNVDSQTIGGRDGYIVCPKPISMEWPGENSVFIIENVFVTIDGKEIKSWSKVWTNDWTTDNIRIERYDYMPDF